jgi:YD repeat-containing protein
MTERDGWGLRERVRTCRIQRSWYFRKCGAEACETEERGDDTTLEFLADGSLARRLQHNPDGSEWTATYEYNEAGRLTTARSENGAGLLDLQSYEYSAAGQLVRVIARPNGGGDRIAESYEYDSAGRKKKTFYVDLASQVPNTHYGWGVEGTDTSYSAPGAATLTTLYNEREQPTDLDFHDGAGRLLSRVQFRYDRDGNLIEEAQTIVAEMLPPEMIASLNQAQLEAVRSLLGGDEPIRGMHRYNEQGRKDEAHSRMGQVSEDRKTVAYNDHGDQIEEIFEHDQREYGMDDEGRLSDAPTSESVSRSEARFRYEYDAFGNWVMKTIESRGSTDQDYTVSSVERRVIGYFE